MDVDIHVGRIKEDINDEGPVDARRQDELVNIVEVKAQVLAFNRTVIDENELQVPARTLDIDITQDQFKADLFFNEFLVRFQKMGHVDIKCRCSPVQR